MLQFHLQYHGRDGHNKRLVFAADEVSEGPTTTSKLLFITIRFDGCATTYPLSILKKNSAYKDCGGTIAVPSISDILRRVLVHIRDKGFSIIIAIGDFPIRAKYRCAVGHSGEDIHGFREGEREGDPPPEFGF